MRHFARFDIVAAHPVHGEEKGRATFGEESELALQAFDIMEPQPKTIMMLAARATQARPSLAKLAKAKAAKVPKPKPSSARRQNCKVWKRRARIRSQRPAMLTLPGTTVRTKTFKRSSSGFCQQQKQKQLRLSSRQQPQSQANQAQLPGWVPCLADATPPAGKPGAFSTFLLCAAQACMSDGKPCATAIKTPTTCKARRAKRASPHKPCQMQSASSASSAGLWQARGKKRTHHLSLGGTRLHHFAHGLDEPELDRLAGQRRPVV